MHNALSHRGRPYRHQLSDYMKLKLDKQSQRATPSINFSPNSPRKRHPNLRESERYTQIEKNNRQMLQKIQSMDLRASKVTNKTRKRSLNYEHRKRELIKITMENQKLLSRIQNQKSEYSMLKHKKERSRNLKFVKNMCNYPYQLQNKIKRSESQISISTPSMHPVSQHGFGSFNQQKTLAYTKDIELQDQQFSVQIFKDAFGLEIMAYSNTGDHDYQMILSYHELYQIIDNLKHIPKLLKMLSILDGDLVIINRKQSISPKRIKQVLSIIKMAEQQLEERQRRQFEIEMKNLFPQLSLTLLQKFTSFKNLVSRETLVQAIIDQQNSPIINSLNQVLLYCKDYEQEFQKLLDGFDNSFFSQFDKSTFKIYQCQDQDCQNQLCLYWHNIQDMRRSQAIIKYQSEPCPNQFVEGAWIDQLQCPYKDQCTYSHNDLECQFHPDQYKLFPCIQFSSTSECIKGEQCSFKHNWFDIQSPDIIEQVIAIYKKLENEKKQLQEDNERMLEDNKSKDLEILRLMKQRSCPHCLQQVSRDFLCIPCGHLLCHNCIELVNEQSYTSCPYCITHIEDIISINSNQNMQVPCQESENWVDLSDLPNEEDTLELLRTELPPLKYWLATAVTFNQLEYYKQGMPKVFERILKVAVSEDIEKMPQCFSSREDRIVLLNRLAAFMFGSGYLCTDFQRREELFNNASSYIRQADQQDINDHTNWVSRAFLLLFKSQLDSAQYYFNNTINQEPNNIFALLGKACIQYHMKGYQDALKLYADVLRNNPGVPGNIRFGVAYCQYKLGNKKEAKKALKRGLDIDYNNADAHVALGILYYEGQNYEKYLQCIAQAYQIDQSNLQACLHLSKHYFLQDDYDRSKRLAEFCINRLIEAEKTIADISLFRAECLTILAQNYHALGDFENAYRNYSQACRQESDFTLAKFGLGQMYLHQKDIEKAKDCFESVHKQIPNNYETMKILGSIYVQQHQKDKAIEKFQAVLIANPEDAEAWIELAQVLEISKPEKALEAYEKALLLIPDPPAELWNNIAVLRHKTGRPEEAEEAYNKLENEKRSILFNKARWHEDSGRLEEATELYKKIIEESPKYTDAYLRLALIARHKNNYAEAIEQTRVAIKNDPKPSSALCLKGYLEAELGELTKAMETYNNVIMNHSRHDLYALTAMGQLYYELSIKSNEERFQKQLSRALQYFSKVISIDEHNVYAAIGIGIYLAEIGETEKAHETFRIVMNVTDIPFMLINDGHIALLQGRYDMALRMYQRARDKKALTREIVDNYVAMALFTCRKYEECEAILRLMPEKAYYKFNLALTLHEHAIFIFSQQFRTYEDTKLAVDLVLEAKTLYESVLKTRWVISGGSDVREIEKNKIKVAQTMANSKMSSIKALSEQCPGYLETSILAEQSRGRNMKRSPELELEEDVVVKRQKTDENSELSLGDSLDLSD